MLPATGSIMSFFCILTHAHTFSIFAWQMANIFIHDSYLLSLLDFVFAIRSIYGDVSSKTPMKQKVPGFSQQSMTPTLKWKNVTKNTVLFDPN
jgi:hypothetical protein